ncbi:MAG: NADH-quinone oxidoreductase subunit J [Opitutae bacterium]|nr:NADH-quinone oxidoreductase subunit J [Opitutae bacterium]
MINSLFYIFASLMLLSALVMVLNKNAVNSAMCMIVTLVSTAGLFILLEAYFLAILQVLVYAGAVMVLFLFIIMLLDVDKGNNYEYLKQKFAFFAQLLGFSLLFFLVFNSFSKIYLPTTELVQISNVGEAGTIAFSNTAKSFGQILFTKYMLPFQVIGFLLLVAMIGVIVISKKQSTDTEK